MASKIWLALASCSEINNDMRFGQEGGLTLTFYEKIHVKIKPSISTQDS